MQFDLHIASTLGVLLGMALLAGLVADFLRLPKVTAYLLVGLALGPSWLDLIPDQHFETFDPLLKLAMALVLYNLGSQFGFSRLGRIAARCLVISFGELVATFALVVAGLLLFGATGPSATLLGCLALATAPATTVLVLREYRSEGPVTESTGFLVAMNNFAAIVAFEVAFVVINLMQGRLDVPLIAQVGILLRDILGSVGAGFAAGLILSYGCQLVPKNRWLVMLVALTTCLLGICESLAIPYMLTFLVMGVTMANHSRASDEVVIELGHITGLLAVIFFVVHGAELDVQAFIAAGLIGVVYIATRSVGKWAGVYVSARLSHQPLELRRYLGSCLLAQAGAAIGLATIAVHRDESLGRPVQNIILGSVVVFEILGPLMIRWSLLRAGEVPIAEAIHHTGHSPLSDLWDWIAARWQPATPRRSDPLREPTVGELMRKTPGIPRSAGFAEVISHIEHCHDNTYPVVDEVGQVVGVVRYTLLSNVMFDATVSGLVRAEDLATPVDSLLYADDPVSKAVDLFQRETDDCIPVVTSNAAATLLGVVRRRDVTSLMIRQRKKATSNSTAEPPPIPTNALAQRSALTKR